MRNPNARILRKNQTKAEQLIWNQLRAKRFQNYKFRRQQPIGPYIVDFYCSSKKIIIELDGSSHACEDKILYDTRVLVILKC